MRKLVEISQLENEIQCDNPHCDFIINNATEDPFVDLKKYLNMECPDCGENLLTEKDYLESIRFIKTINWVNKWFSWITIFFPKNKKPTITNVHVHNGVKFEK
jgi:hypothetical protein